MTHRSRLICELTGWLLFVVSAVFFTWASLRAGDMLATGGSLFFLVACFAFLLPYIFQRYLPDEG